LEQTQLDAVTLSLCYQNREFLTEWVRKPNRNILHIQNLLNMVGTSCLTEFAATSVVATPALAQADLVTCVSTRMRPLEGSGIALEALQEFKASRFQISRHQERQYLLRQNRLSEKFVSFRGFSPVAAGLRRGSLSPETNLIRSQLLSLGHSVKWPRLWISNPLTFSPSLSPQLEYQPQNKRGLRKSNSSCEILAQDPFGADQVKWRASTP